MNVIHRIGGIVLLGVLALGLAGPLPADEYHDDGGHERHRYDDRRPDRDRGDWHDRHGKRDERPRHDGRERRDRYDHRGYLERGGVEVIVDGLRLDTRTQRPPAPRDAEGGPSICHEADGGTTWSTRDQACPDPQPPERSNTWSTSPD